MKWWKTGMVLLVLSGFLPACIPTQQQMRMERDLEEMKRRLATIEQSSASQNKQADLTARIETLGLNQADLQASLDTLRVEFQSMQGRQEEMNRQRNDLREDLSLVQEDMALKISALEERIDQLETSQSQTSTPAVAPLSPQAAYEEGVRLIRSGQSSKGRDVLENFLREHPDNSLAVNAMYWIGEAYYGEKKFENAILQFQDVIQKNGDHPKAAAALLKQGLTFNTLGDRQNAKVILNRVIEEFPLSEEAKKAEERLKEWEQG